MFRTPSGRMVRTIEEVNFEIFGTSRPAASNISGDQQAAWVAENRAADDRLRQGFTDEMRRATERMQAQGMSGDQIMQALAQQFPQQTAQLQAAPGGETPMPKPMPVGMPGNDTTSPVVSGPSVPGQPSGGAGGSPVYSGGSGAGRVNLMDWRAGLAETDKGAVTRSVQDTELTSKQLSRLLDENGRFIQSARLRAKEGASNSGMLMSTIAAGAAERAAIDAALPIAQGDANTFFQTSSENMRAQNEDVQADQGAGRNLFGQQVGLDAQAQENELGRRFTSAENAAQRSFSSDQAGLDRGLTREQNAMQRELQQLMQREGFSFQEAQAELDRRLTQDQNYLQRQQTSTIEGNRLSQDRFNSFVNMQASRENQLAQTLSSIYSNPNLNADQQRAAAENARAIFSSLNSATNATLSNGVPQIFAQPFVMPGQAAPTTPASPTAPTGTGLQPGFTPIPGTDLASGPGGVIRRAIDVALARG